MRGRRILACLLSAALVAGMLPAAALAAEDGPQCDNHKEHTAECGFVEGRPCGHSLHTADCYTDELICAAQSAAGDMDTPHEHTQECYALDCPHERGVHDDTCGYVDAQPCGHICELCAPQDSGIPRQPADHGAIMPLEAPVPTAITGNGYSFEPSTGKLSVSSNDGTTAWKENSNISSSNVTSAAFGSSVTEIGMEAFEGCANLKSLDLSACNGLESIGNRAFKNCAALELSELPDTVTYIGVETFYGCGSLALTTLPSGLTSISPFAFSRCSSLALTSLSNQITKIGASAFSFCTNLELTALPDGIAAINDSAFLNCPKLKLTKLPDTVTAINGSAFSGCTGITSLTFTQTTAPTLKVFALPSSLSAIFVPKDAAGYDGANWPADKVVYGAALSDMELSSGALAPAFFPGTNTYSVYVANSVESVTVTPTAHESETITVNNSVVTSGNASGLISLTEGTSTAITVVAKKSDTDSRTYTINVTRMAQGAVSVTGVALDQAALTLYTNKNPGTATLTATVQPDNATVKDVTWKSSNTGVATVDSTGKVVAVSPGTATITAITSDGGKTAACTVTVEESSIPVTGVILDQTALTLYTSKSPSTATLTATVQPGNATNKTVSWTSSAPGVATVDSGGKVTAVASGTATITVATQDGNHTAACTVTVEQGGSSGGGGGSSSSGSSYLRRTLSDKPTGVKVAGDRIHEDATLIVNAGALHKAGDAGCDLLRSAQNWGRVLSHYDISLSRGFRGSVTVSLPVEGWDGQTLTVAHCTGGRLVLSNVNVEKGMAAVTVDDLSPFALLDGVYTMETLAAPALENPFIDVKETDWFYNAVMYAYQSGLMSGTSATTFDPQGPVTRAQPPVVLYRLEGSPAVMTPIPFADVRPGQWYADGVTWATGAGLVSGYNASAYGPADPITREQLVSILYRYAQYKKWDVAERDGLTAYTDAGDVSAWAREAVEWAVGAGLLKGSGGKLAPKAGATRAEFAQMLQRFMEQYQPAAPVALAPGTSKPRRHRVQKGDTLSALARRFNCTVTELVAANPMIKNPDFILPGWEIDIP